MQQSDFLNSLLPENQLIILAAWSIGSTSNGLKEFTKGNLQSLLQQADFGLTGEALSQILAQSSAIIKDQGQDTYRFEEDIKWTPKYVSRALEPQDDPTRLKNLGMAQAKNLERHQLEYAVVTLQRAFDLFLDSDSRNDQDAIDIATFPFYPPVGNYNGLIDQIDRVLGLSSLKLEDRALLLARRGTVLGMREGGDYGGSQRLFNEALDIVKDSDDKLLEMRVLASAARVDRFHLRFDKCLERSSRVITLARSAEPLDTYGNYAQILAHRLAGNVLTYTGLPSKASPHTEALLELSNELKDKYWQETAYVALEREHRLAGNWNKARHFSDQGLSISPLELRLLTTRILMEYELGNEKDGEVFLGRLLQRAIGQTAGGVTSEHATLAVVVPLVAMITGKRFTKGLTEAQQRVEEILPGDTKEPPQLAPILELMAQVGKALLSVVNRDPKIALEQYQILAGRLGEIEILPTGTAMVKDRLLGLLSVTFEDLDTAVSHFNKARSLCEREGCLPQLAWACHEQAGALMKRNKPGDMNLAKILWDQALSLSSALEMVALKNQIGESSAP